MKFPLCESCWRHDLIVTTRPTRGRIYIYPVSSDFFRIVMTTRKAKKGEIRSSSCDELRGGWNCKTFWNHEKENEGEKSSGRYTFETWHGKLKCEKSMNFLFWMVEISREIDLFLLNFSRPLSLRKSRKISCCLFMYLFVRLFLEIPHWTFIKILLDHFPRKFFFIVSEYF